MGWQRKMKRNKRKRNLWKIFFIQYITQEIYKKIHRHWIKAMTFSLIHKMNIYFSPFLHTSSQRFPFSSVVCSRLNSCSCFIYSNYYYYYRCCYVVVVKKKCFILNMCVIACNILKENISQSVIYKFCMIYMNMNDMLM